MESSHFTDEDSKSQRSPFIFFSPICPAASRSPEQPRGAGSGALPVLEDCSGQLEMVRASRAPNFSPDNDASSAHFTEVETEVWGGKEAAQGKGSQMSASLAALDSNNSDTPATPMPSETSAALTLSHAQASGLLVNQTEPIGTRSCAVPKSRLPSLASFLIPPSQLEEVRRPSDPEHCPHSQGEKQVTSTGSVDEGTTRGLEPQSARFSWLNDFRHGILPLTLSFLICRMGTVIKMFTPSVAVHNRESMDPTLGMGQALRK